MTESSESLKITTEPESNKSPCCRAASFIVGHTQYSQYTTTKMCSNLYAAQQVQTLSWSTALCSDPACSRLQDRHALMGENKEDIT